MDINMNKLIDYFSNNHFTVEKVFHNRLGAGITGIEKTAPYPGFIFPIKGRAMYSFNKTPYISELGGIVHGGAEMELGTQVSDRGCEYILVLYDTSTSISNGLNLHDMHFKIDISENNRLSSLLWKLKNTAEGNNELTRFQTQNLFRTILEEVFINVQESDNKSTKHLYEIISTYISNHYMEELSVRQLAEVNNVNENQLFYAFSKYAGMGTGEYIIKCRLNKASQLLMQTEDTVCSISESVGYMDPLYFSRIFKKNYGVSPTIYREKVRNNLYSA